MINHLIELAAEGTLTERTYRGLKNAIVELKLKPGALLLEEELSEQLGVSRTPIHSALNRLSHEGLVTIIKGKGTIVAPLTEVQLTDLFAVRKVLEGLAVELCAQSATQEDLRELHYLLQWQRETFSGKQVNILDFLYSDTEFHSLLGKIANNAYLEVQLKMILELTRRYTIAYTADRITPLVLEEHREIYEQIKQGNGKAANERIIRHLCAVESRVRADIRAAEQNCPLSIGGELNHQQHIDH